MKKVGPLKMAHLNGLSVSRQPVYSDIKDEPERASNDERVGHQQPSVLEVTQQTFQLFCVNLHGSGLFPPLCTIISGLL